MKKNPLYKSFGFAFEGIINTVKQERNMKIHCFMMMCVILAGLIFRISRIEWLICFILFGLILSLELVNTSIEAAVDLVTDDRKPMAKKAKDAAAGAVLISAIFAAIIGLIIFVPKLLALIKIL